MQTEEAFVALLKTYIHGLELIARAFLMVTDSALLKLEPQDDAYAADLAFMETLSWGSFEDPASSNFASAKRFLRLLGDRTT